jgi:valyl-tRNA synthetase
MEASQNNKFKVQNDKFQIDNDYQFELSFADKWILSRYNSTIEKLNNALNEYKLTEYSKIVYDFIWRDFCDWYIEILKVQLNQTSDNEYKKHLIRFSASLYENTMKILHPVMPFITEEIYHLIENRNEDESISIAEFPKATQSLINSEIETQFELIQNIVEEVRKLRASINIPTQKLPARISVKNEKTLTVFQNLKLVLMNLCKFNELEIGINTVKPAGATSTVYREIEVNLVATGAIDTEQERQRLEKEIARLEGNIRVCENKLNNEKFITKASPEIIAKEREKLASMQESLKKIRATSTSVLHS